MNTSSESPPVNTPLYRLVDTILPDTDLAQFLVSRSEGLPHTHPHDGGEQWPAGACDRTHPTRLVARELFEITKVDITPEAVRKWTQKLREPADE